MKNPSIPNTNKILPLDYLKVFLVTLVVLHHSILAYNTFFSFNNAYLVAGIIPISNLINPIIDSSKSRLFDIFVIFNDSFFMSAMFFISGIFFWKSLAKKGVKNFLKDRFKRLGIPFIIGIILIIPLSYYPANLENKIFTGEGVSYFTFFKTFIGAKFISSGPLWFLWVLLTFNLISIIIFKYILNSEKIIDNIPTKLFSTGIFYFLIFMLLTTLTFIPLSLKYNLNKWGGYGPFVFQYVRIGLYYTNFILGVSIGIFGFEKSCFERNKPISKYWFILLLLGAPLAIISTKNPAPLFPFACTLITFGFIGLFQRVIRKEVKFIDNLSRCSFGIYIFHYLFTSWGQYFLIKIELSGNIKGVIVFIFAYTLSWLITHTLRKSYFIRSYL